MKTPVLFLIYNRPHLEKQVFEKIRQIKPTQLYIAADGPKNISDKKLCDEAKKIITTIDWPCRVHKLYRKKNLGCGKAVSGAIDWFFSKVNEGIILEDDCLPDLSFFPYCEELLDKYRLNKSIMLIGGNTFFSTLLSPHSYNISKFPHIWGWASWRRSWRLYDYHMKSLPDYLSNNTLGNIFPDSKDRSFWVDFLTKSYNKKIDSWDIQLAYCCLKHNGLCVIPKINLVKNLGFCKDALHTKRKAFLFMNTTNKIGIPLHHRTNIRVSRIIDTIIQRNIYRSNQLFNVFSVLKNFV